MRRALPHLAAVLVSLGMLALPLAAYAATGTVKIESFGFHPQTIYVHAGDTVTWTNADTSGHTATSVGGWDTGTFGNGASRTVLFDRVGTYPYFCLLHSIMFGTVVVLAPNAPIPTAAPVPSVAPVITPAPTPAVQAYNAELAAAPLATAAPATLVRVPTQAGPGPVIVAAAAMAIVAFTAFAWLIARQS